MAGIGTRETGLVFRNPKPHLRSVHAYFPSVAALSEREMLCAMVIGSAFESVDGHVEFFRSFDEGKTWDAEGRLLPAWSKGVASESCRITRMSDGELVALMMCADRTDPEEGLANAETLGFVPTEFCLFRSLDDGRTWSGPEEVTPPVVGPSYESNARIVELSDGRWLLYTSTWRAWDGYDPTGMKAVAFLSDDKGKTWPEYSVVLDGSADGVIHWEQKIIELKDNRILSIAWAYDERTGSDRPNVYALSEDGGRSFGIAQSTGLPGQTSSIIEVGDGEILCVYRRVDDPGLWADIASLERDEWINHERQCLWRPALPEKKKDTVVEKFHALRLGAPVLVRLPGGDIFLALWCYEDCVSNIRWFRLRLKSPRTGERK